jgi:hypothetical protein
MRRAKIADYRTDDHECPSKLLGCCDCAEMECGLMAL